MSKVKAVIHSFRLRTLPLSIAGAVAASLTAVRQGAFRWRVFVLLIFTVMALQILANLCNELGDWKKGTDRSQTARLRFSLQEGQLTVGGLSRIILVTACVTVALGMGLIFASFGSLFCRQAVVFMLLGLLAVVAAVRYTLGAHAYGYHALGDLSVLLFFGLLSVCGSHYLYVHVFSPIMLLPALSIGLLAVGVLNTNNIRDIDNDRLHGKHTVAGYLGIKGAKSYETALIVVALGVRIWQMLLQGTISCPWSWLWLLSLPLLGMHLYRLWPASGAAVDRAFVFLPPGILLFALTY